MDLLECLTCKQRFIVDDAGDGHNWRCPSDGNELALVIRSLPGASGQIEAALNARPLSPTSPAERGQADQALRRRERQLGRVIREYLAERAQPGTETALYAPSVRGDRRWST